MSQMLRFHQVAVHLEVTILEQKHRVRERFSTSLMLGPSNTVSHIVGTPAIDLCSVVTS